MKSFKSYISLQEQSPEDLTFDEPTTKHSRIMNKPHEILPVNSDQSLVSSPPSNSSDETRVELMELQDRVEMKKDNDELLRKWDLDLVVPFIKYLKDNNLKHDKKFLDDLVSQSTIIVLKQKYIFNRPRPKQLAKSLGIPLSALKSGTAATPSYPSGHSTQSRLVALYLSGLHRDHAKSFVDMAEECGQSRLNAGLHYPSDHEAGVDLGNKLYASMKTDEISQLKYRDLPAHVYGMEGY
tara:strand:+ start:63 stop:779 length:717 start_codon:yes stop_codon:yes gene_type:complete